DGVVDGAEGEVFASLRRTRRGEHHRQALMLYGGDPQVHRVGAPRRSGALDLRVRRGRVGGRGQSGRNGEQDEHGQCRAEAPPAAPRGGQVTGLHALTRVTVRVPVSTWAGVSSGSHNSIVACTLAVPSPLPVPALASTAPGLPRPSPLPVLRAGSIEVPALTVPSASVPVPRAGAQPRLRADTTPAPPCRSVATPLTDQPGWSGRVSSTAIPVRVPRNTKACRCPALSVLGCPSGPFGSTWTSSTWVPSTTRRVSAPVNGAVRLVNESGMS